MNVGFFNLNYAKETQVEDRELYIKLFLIVLIQGCHGTGKTGNLKVHFSRQGKHREFVKKY